MSAINKFLADGLAALNAALAVLIVFIAGLAGGAAYGALGLGLGVVLGMVVATVVCGALAVVLDIRENLVAIQARLEAAEPPPTLTISPSDR